ncbi:hypothetical protein BDV27DRAFT_134166 [Aspergillus caelatus]|uniref:Uncharacterized protein n=1 Tax=Aspergillus caelatus TaxID=61420 RepID=A0A5N6ZUR0_9EURO|nr:uncharacterized protein BDV27DRAFT_134166 [Aspergillus caelatus]KAE8360649.1 hypothetical protein BDV27DRAFT_134166 [Aspergillus caelatus]
MQFSLLEHFSKPRPENLVFRRKRPRVWHVTKPRVDLYAAVASSYFILALPWRLYLSVLWHQLEQRH